MKSNVAWIDDVHLLTVCTVDLLQLIHVQQAPVIYSKVNDIYFSLELGEIIDEYTTKITIIDELPIGEVLTLLWGDQKIPVHPGAIVRTDWFDQHYSNLDAELGASYTKIATTFSIWAPTATSIKLSLDEKLLLLNRQDGGIWKVKVHGDWHGYAYNYQAIINGQTKYINDPYTKAILINSEKSVVVDLNMTDVEELSEVKRPVLESLSDAIIYELHVKDATMHPDSGAVHRGKYLGLTEKNTATKNGFSTGLTFIKELGFTHVQLLPINDFARVDEQLPESSYNWGYDPLFFQVPEGSFSLAPENPLTRIREVKKMIHSFHAEGLSVILDVVYNHVFIMKESPFEQLVPGYYFRYHEDGTLSNGTGVGNDLATERNMVRKFIVDTVDFWLQEYQIDGFRFDLMGAMDIQTMQEIQEICNKETTPIMLLGEGWHLNTALACEEKATSANSYKIKSIKFFNDYFRDTLKGNLFNNRDTGYINGNGHFIERLPNLISGSALPEYGAPFVSEVNQTVNYVECHDNHTLWDRLLLTNNQENDSTRKKMHQLATGITLLSQGTPFIHAGQEWFRSKNGDENSYISSAQVNQLDWEQREIENENILFIQALIALRKKYKVFRLSSNQEVREKLRILNTPDPVFGFSLLDEYDRFSIFINPTRKQMPIHLPSSGEWEVSLTNIRNRENLKIEVDEQTTSIQPYELIVFKKSINSSK